MLSGCRADSLPTNPPPKLTFDESAADDFRDLASETWDKFLIAFEARTDCFGDVHLQAVSTLHSRRFMTQTQPRLRCGCLVARPYSKGR